MKRLRLLALLVAGLVLSASPPIHAQPAWSDTSGYLEVEDARLFFRTVGEGTPLVFVHGGPGMSHGYLTPQVVRLLTDDYRLVFYDQRGSGRPTGVKDTTRLTIEQFVEDLETVRKEFGLKRMNLLGHSFGGLLAMNYATTYPSHVEKLLLLDTAASSWERLFPYFRKTIAKRRPEADQREMNAIEAQEEFGKDPEMMERYWHLFFRSFFHNQSLNDSLALELDEQWLANYGVTGRLVQKRLGRYDIHDQLDRISAPTLILHGDASTISVEAAEAIHERIPHSQLIVLDDVGHFHYIEAPQAFKAAVKAFIW